MPYEPDERVKMNARRRARAVRRRQTQGNIVALAAVLSVLVAFFNLYVSWPLGVPPEFVLFLILAAIFTALWWTIRKNNSGARSKADNVRPPIDKE